MVGDFELDEVKAASDIEKHGVRFEEAATAVVDEKAVFLVDENDDEARFRV